MWVLCKISKVGELTNIRTSKGEEIAKVEIQLYGCGDFFIAAAFDKVALELNHNKPVVGRHYWAELKFAVAGGEKLFQNVRLDNLMEF